MSSRRGLGPGGAADVAGRRPPWAPPVQQPAPAPSPDPLASLRAVPVQRAVLEVAFQLATTIEARGTAEPEAVHQSARALRMILAPLLGLRPVPQQSAATVLGSGPLTDPAA